MQMQRSGMSGCCVGTYYYDLGGAHSKYRAKSIEEFAVRMLEIGMNQINIAVTNDIQAPERKFLEELGFKEVFRDQNGKGRMYVHAVDSTVLTKSLEPYRLKQQQIYEERKRKEREEQERRQREARERAAALKAKKEMELKAATEKAEKDLAVLEKITSNDEVTIEFLRELYNRFPGIPVRNIMSKAFGFKLDGLYAFPDYERRWDDAELLRSVNSRLRKRKTLTKDET